MTRIKQGIYRHYQGKLYEVIGVARHSETLERMVVYKGLYDHPEFGKNPLWVRPHYEFMEKIQIGDKVFPRFEFVKKSDESESK